MDSLPPTILGVSIIVVASAIDGLALMGAVLFCFRRFQRRAARIEPGEWLLAILGFRLAARLLLQTWLSPTFQNPEAVVHGFSCALFVLPTLQRKLATRWKVMFGVISLLYLLPICFEVVWPIVFGTRPWGADIFLNGRGLPPGLTTAALVFGLSLFEIRFRRDSNWSWLHWTGVGVCLVAVFTTLLLGLVA